MKIREKRYLFEGFLNVFWVSLIALFLGFAMGSFIGILAGVATSVQKQVDFCMKYPQFEIEECAVFHNG